jgi:tRNA U34 5-carboxymethylaminomethyl modifying GTPase MnmE/TrmE
VAVVSSDDIVERLRDHENFYRHYLSIEAADEIERLLRDLKHAHAEIDHHVNSIVERDDEIEALRRTVSAQEKVAEVLRAACNDQHAEIELLRAAGNAMASILGKVQINPDGNGLVVAMLLDRWAEIRGDR